jgi:hypothetical protein
MYGQEITHFDFVLDIDMKAKKIHVEGDMQVDFKQTDTIVLVLYKYSTIHSILSGNVTIEYIFDTASPPPMFVPDGRNLTLVKPPGSPSKQQVNIEYECDMHTLGGWANSFHDYWTELNLYCAWFPTNFNSGAFTAETKVTTDIGFDITGSGIVSREKGYWKMVQPWPAYDIIIIASSKLDSRVMKQDNAHIEAVYHDFTESGADSVIQECEFAMDFYQELFGKSDSTYLKFILSPFDQGGGYARKNFIVMRTKTFNMHTRKGIGHEMAHFWWSNAETSSWEDWLNEAFAEYSMLMYLRERLGQVVFDEYIALYQDKTKDTPPIYNIDRNGPDAYNVLYNKGSLILHQLEQKMGQEEFKNFLRMTADNKISNTADLLSMLTNNFSGELSIWLESKIKTE